MQSGRRLKCKSLICKKRHPFFPQFPCHSSFECHTLGIAFFSERVVFKGEAEDNGTWYVARICIWKVLFQYARDLANQSKSWHYYTLVLFFFFVRIIGTLRELCLRRMIKISALKFQTDDHSLPSALLNLSLIYLECISNINSNIFSRRKLYTVTYVILQRIINQNVYTYIPFVFSFSLVLVSSF